MTFALIGWLQSEMLAELKTLLETTAKIKKTVLDLKEVRLVDRDVVRFLARFETDSGRITNCPPYIREWIRRERTQQ